MMSNNGNFWKFSFCIVFSSWYACCQSARASDTSYCSVTSSITGPAVLRCLPLLLSHGLKQEQSLFSQRAAVWVSLLLPFSSGHPGQKLGCRLSIKGPCVRS